MAVSAPMPREAPVMRATLRSRFKVVVSVIRFWILDFGFWIGKGFSFTTETQRTQRGREASVSLRVLCVSVVNRPRSILDFGFWILDFGLARGFRSPQRHREHREERRPPSHSV